VVALVLGVDEDDAGFDEAVAEVDDGDLEASGCGGTSTRREDPPAEHAVEAPTSSSPAHTSRLWATPARCSAR